MVSPLVDNHLPDCRGVASSIHLRLTANEIHKLATHEQATLFHTSKGQVDVGVVIRLDGVEIVGLWDVKSIIFVHQCTHLKSKTKHSP